jgi:hypothetical protein
MGDEGIVAIVELPSSFGGSGDSAGDEDFLEGVLGGGDAISKLVVSTPLAFNCHEVI